MSRRWAPAAPPAAVVGVIGPPEFRVAVGWRPVNACGVCGGPTGPAAPVMDTAGGASSWRLRVVAACPVHGPQTVDQWAAAVGARAEADAAADVAGAVACSVVTTHCVVRVECSACGWVNVEAAASSTPGLAVHRVHAHGPRARVLEGVWVVAHRVSGKAVGGFWQSAEDAHTTAALLGSAPGAPDWRASFEELDTVPVRTFVQSVARQAPPANR